MTTVRSTMVSRAPEHISTYLNNAEQLKLSQHCQIVDTAINLTKKRFKMEASLVRTHAEQLRRTLHDYDNTSDKGIDFRPRIKKRIFAKKRKKKLYDTELYGSTFITWLDYSSHSIVSDFETADNQEDCDMKRDNNRLSNKLVGTKRPSLCSKPHFSIPNILTVQSDRQEEQTGSANNIKGKVKFPSIDRRKVKKTSTHQTAVDPVISDANRQQRVDKFLQEQADLNKAMPIKLFAHETVENVLESDLLDKFRNQPSKRKFVKKAIKKTDLTIYALERLGLAPGCYNS